MKFALFYEIPVPRPWEEDSELIAYQNTLEQAIAGDKFGWHAFWTVEHHFLQEYSHCSNPEVLYGAIAARTENIRLGYGVRLMPKPYNHPVRTAESVAVLDLLSKGRVDMGAGRSATRTELEGFGVDPAETRQMWQEALGHIVGCWTNDEYEFEGEYWQMPRRRVQPKPWQKPHPPLWGATTSDEGHAQVGGSRPRPVLVRRGPAPGGGEAQDRRLPGRRRAVHAARSAPSCTTRRPRSPWRCAVPTPRRPRKRPASRSSGTPRRAPARSPRSRTGWPSASRSSAATRTPPT